MTATVSDLRAFFAVVAKPPAEVVAADVFGFITEQRRPRGDGHVVRLADGECGLATRTIKRRLSSVSGLFGYLVIIGEVPANPVPRDLATRQARRRRSGGAALVRTPRTLPEVLDPADVNALFGALRRWRDPGHGRGHGGEVLGSPTRDLRFRQPCRGVHLSYVSL